MLVQHTPEVVVDGNWGFSQGVLDDKGILDNVIKL
jgi:hypothetical protein